ncbi:MAG: hypothetical protein M3Y72_05215 [Acidobacteriota bacterium]|nr:hypothetical protein [Acidobacteriota bacterium]
MLSRLLAGPLIFGVLSLVCPELFAQAAQLPPASMPVPLQVENGTPLRLYLIHRIRFSREAPVQAKFAQAVWAFDRVVIPMGSLVQGRITDLQPVPKMARAMAIVRGDFTPLKQAWITFTGLSLPDGTSLPLTTIPSSGLATVYVPPRPGKKAPAAQPKQAVPANSRFARLSQFVKQKTQAYSASSNGTSFLDLVRGPNKVEWVQDFLWSKLPYHPQWYRSGTRFDAVLQKPLDFGKASVAAGSLQDLGGTPSPDHPANVRLFSTLSSADAKVGDPVSGILSEPLFSAHHQLVFPEGTRLTGKVTLVHPARMFHRGGQLRFIFNNIEPNQLTSIPAARPEHTDAQLTAAESKSGNVKVDEEGTAKASESKARFLRPIIAGLVAAQSGDNDAGRPTPSGAPVAGANYGGRALGGFSGFGLFGIAAGFGPRPIGMGLGYYGFAWSIYSTLVSRGSEVVFEKNSALTIRFAPPPTHH